MGAPRGMFRSFLVGGSFEFRIGVLRFYKAALAGGFVDDRISLLDEIDGSGGSPAAPPQIVEPAPPEPATAPEPQPNAERLSETRPASGPLVAILNHDDELTRSVCEAFEAEGFRTVGGRIPAPPGGHEEVIAFLDEHDPDVVVFDLVQPYADYVETLRAVRRVSHSKPRVFVLTTTNRRALAKYGIAKAVELREPEDLADLTEAVRRAVTPNDAA
jgi:CheY-like chemotaxis protein